MLAVVTALGTFGRTGDRPLKIADKHQRFAKKVQRLLFAHAVTRDEVKPGAAAHGPHVNNSV
ncbi:hypothetical protein SDC9_152893 [bioreactor metagenome]|uniref:Uncharacterized protein n=1 Tax=bioreactor metagenome TaxID=1076179 RepID=A0A645EWN9_9ZZZZ